MSSKVVGGIVRLLDTWMWVENPTYHTSTSLCQSRVVRFRLTSLRQAQHSTYLGHLPVIPAASLPVMPRSNHALSTRSRPHASFPNTDSNRCLLLPRHRSLVRLSPPVRLLVWRGPR